ADRIELVADRREAWMVNALGNVGQPRPFAARRIEAPQHPLGLPARENTEAAEHIELAARRSSVDLLFALRDRLERGPLALRERRAGRQHTNQNGRRYGSAHWFPPLFAVACCGCHEGGAGHCPIDVASSITDRIAIRGRANH